MEYREAVMEKTSSENKDELLSFGGFQELSFVSVSKMLPAVLTSFFPRPLKNQMVQLENVSDYINGSLFAESILVPLQCTSFSSQHNVQIRLFAEVQRKSSQLSKT